MGVGLACWIVFGVVAGAAARSVMPGPSAGGMPVAILIGIGGAVIGGFIGTALQDGVAAGFDLRSMLMAVATSLMLLLFYRAYALRTGLDVLT